MKKKTSQTKDKFNFKGAVKIAMIEDFMKKNNLSKEDFAKLCRIETKELRKILDDFSVFEPICLLKIARTMGVDFADLVN